MREDFESERKSMREEIRALEKEREVYQLLLIGAVVLAVVLGIL